MVMATTAMMMATESYDVDGDYSQTDDDDNDGHS